MSKLLEFFKINDISKITEEVEVSKRLPEKFIVKAVNQNRFGPIQNKCIGKSTKNGVDFDGNTFNILLILEGCTYPNFASEEFVKGVNATDPKDAIVKCLLPGEISDLAKAISKLSGFDSDINVDIEQAKN